MRRPSFFREIGARPEGVEAVRDVRRCETIYLWDRVEVGRITDAQMMRAEDVTIDWNEIQQARAVRLAAPPLLLANRGTPPARVDALVNGLISTLGAPDGADFDGTPALADLP